MNEEWRDVKGYEGLYRVSNMGRVYSLRTHTFLSAYYREKNGWCGALVKLTKSGDKKYVLLPRIVMEAFRPEEAAIKKQIKHKDGNVRNNRLDNLEFAKKDKVKNEFSPYRKSREIYCVELDRTFISAGEAAAVTGAQVNAILCCCNNLKYFKTAGGYHWRFADEVKTREEGNE